MLYRKKLLQCTAIIVSSFMLACGSLPADLASDQNKETSHDNCNIFQASSIADSLLSHSIFVTQSERVKLPYTYANSADTQFQKNIFLSLQQKFTFL